jgi:hypothetical protein
VTEWYQRRVGHRNASLDRRVIFLKVISPLKLFLLYLSWRPLFSLPIFTCYLAFLVPSIMEKSLSTFSKPFPKFCRSPTVSSLSIRNSCDLYSSMSICAFQLDLRLRQKRTPDDRRSASSCILRLHRVASSRVHLQFKAPQRSMKMQ